MVEILDGASPALLSRVAGVGPLLSENIVAYRNEHGPFAVGLSGEDGALFEIRPHDRADMVGVDIADVSADPGRSPFPPFVNISQTRTEELLAQKIAAEPLIEEV